MGAELEWLGLSQSKVAETIKNKSLTEQLLKIIAIAKDAIARSNVEFTKQKGTLLYQVGTKVKTQSSHHLPVIVRLIVEEKIKTELQVTEAVNYALHHAMGELNISELEKAAGVGVIVTPDEIEAAIQNAVLKFKDQLEADRYNFPIGKILGEVRNALKWADGQYVAREVELQVRLLLGSKTDADLFLKGKGKTDRKEKKAEVVEEEGPLTMEELIRTRTKLHLPGENFKGEGYVVTPHTEKLLKEHLKRTGGKVRTRFPPEPNGLLHIGHAKAININFGYAKAFDGVCFLRFDDTNPEKEEEKFFRGIEEMVRWLGYTPYKITYASDNFQQLYEWAVLLIEKGLAYVCHQAVEDMRGFNPEPSPWRERPVAESLQLFQDMKKGKFDEGEATLRLKVTLEEGKVDPVAYRVKYCHHERSKDAWCIYPTYDYTHCLCDSVEDITHSLCTKEFQNRRSSYYWLCNALDVYCPVQWEYGRLNVNYTVVSKRKILKLIQTKRVRDWDDPRLFTLAALRRRGIPAEALNSFVARLGVTGSQMVLEPHALDAVVREHLNAHSTRTMAVLDPLRVRISNWDSLSLPSRITIPDFPSTQSSHDVAFGPVLFIEKSDYCREAADKQFKRLAKGQAVGLKHAGVILHLEEEETAADGSLTGVVVRAEPLGGKAKPGAFVHWVADPIAVQVRLYERLFHHKNPEDPAEVPGGFLSDCNEDSMTILHAVHIDAYMAKAKVWDKFQFERIGFFCVDPDSRPGKLVFNRTVLLKEDSGKK